MHEHCRVGRQSSAKAAHSCGPGLTVALLGLNNGGIIFDLFALTTVNR